MFMYRVSQKNVSNFEAAKLLTSEILGFPASLDLYNSFDTLFICFHGLMNNGTKLFSKAVSFLKTGILKHFCHKMFTNMLLSCMF